jgi:enoyl-CoA hydratase
MSSVTSSKAGRVATVALQRPPANAMSIELLERLAEAFDSLASDPSVGAVVLTGQGRSFCAGLDLKIVPSLADADQKRLLNALNRALRSVYGCPVPVIAAINGHAIAGGLVLALACDWRIGADWPFLVGLTEVVVGIPYPVAAIEIVRQELGARMARELVLFGEKMTAKAALERGVLDESAPADRLMERAVAKALHACRLPSIGFAKVKRQLRSGVVQRIDAAIAGNEPLLEGWLSRETIQAAVSVLRESSGRGSGAR